MIETNSNATAPLLVVIDDEAPMREVLGAIGKMAGYRVMSGCGKKEVHALLDQQPDAILLDIFMPDMDGIEVIWELERRKSAAAIIVLSGFDPAVLEMATMIAKSTDLQLVSTLAKPTDFAVLRELLRAIARKDYAYFA
jgi:two-component system response regulator YesN